jgi:hypothetical protein
MNPLPHTTRPAGPWLMGNTWLMGSSNPEFIT